jgi:hypothetical protein
LTRYGLTVERTNALPAFRLIDIEHLSAVENRGSNNIFVYVLDANGQRLRWPELRLRVAIAGQPDHYAPLDKRDNPPGVAVERGHGDAPMGCEAVHSASIVDGAGRVVGSDVVHGLSTRHPDEGPWVTMCHHSFRLTFVYTLRAGDGGGVVLPPEEGPDAGGPDVAALRAWLAEGEAWLARGRALVG